MDVNVRVYSVFSVSRLAASVWLMWCCWLELLSPIENSPPSLVLAPLDFCSERSVRAALTFVQRLSSDV
jgi:hypothetical protein